MADLNRVLETLEINEKSHRREKITGRNALIGNLSAFLIEQKRQEKEIYGEKTVLLTTKDGLVLYGFKDGVKGELVGLVLPKQLLKRLTHETPFHRVMEDYLLFEELGGQGREEGQRMAEELEKLIAIFDLHESESQYILKCLDSMDNPLCVFDAEPAFLYGNVSYCKMMHIENKEMALGMNVNDIFEKSGTEIHAKKPVSDKYKMYDVLKSGEKALDWEIRIETQNVSSDMPLVSNNIYPIKAKDGSVEGVIEIMHHNRVDLNKVSKMITAPAEYSFRDIIGASPEIKAKIAQAKEYADSDFNVLITGESGVGKELFAQAMHNYSDRNGDAFIALNCANFSENLIESELFGYVGGAFTGASKKGQVGKFELASGGTLFLDEVGELPYHLQSKFLRVLETGKIRRIGDTIERKVDVRVITATNRDLKAMVEEGSFRNDLYYRLQVLNVEIPPLRERREDIVLLADELLRQSARSHEERVKTLDLSARRALMKYDWPGNVRELRNIMHRIILSVKEDMITGENVETAIYSKGNRLSESQQVRQESDEARLRRCRLDVKASYANLLSEALHIAGGNKSVAADLLQMSRATFYRMLDKYCKDPYTL
ncbi:MAG: sigma 54-interacting transcriptional regulator [Firmicutes bacterium]|nr:sigma 54-interacting transcriptional regulator [Bacillota bacterium]